MVSAKVGATLVFAEHSYHTMRRLIAVALNGLYSRAFAFAARKGESSFNQNALSAPVFCTLNNVIASCDRKRGVWALEWEALMRLLPIIFLASATLLSGCAQVEVFQVRGADRSCADIGDLDTALHDVNNFAGWDEPDFNAAITWASACADYGDPIARSSRVPTLRRYEGKLAFAPGRMKTEQQTLIDQQGSRNIQEPAITAKSKGDSADENERIETETALRKQQQAQQDEARTKQQEAADEQRKQQVLCESSKRFVLYETQEAIISNLTERARYIQARTRQNQLAKVSGVRNLTIEQEIGEALVGLDDDLKDRWIVYKMLGGSAKSPNTVKHTIANPCSAFR